MGWESIQIYEEQKVQSRTNSEGVPSEGTKEETDYLDLEGEV